MVGQFFGRRGRSDERIRIRRIRVAVEPLEERCNPSDVFGSVGSYLQGWYDSAAGAVNTVAAVAEGAAEGLAQGASDLVEGAANTVVQLGYTASDLAYIYTTDSSELDPSRFDSVLFLGAAQTGLQGEQAAQDFDNQLVYGIATLGVGPLAGSLVDAVESGDSTQFSQNAGGFAILVLVPYAAGEGLAALGPVRLPVPVYEPGGVLQTVGGSAIQVPGTIAWEWAAVGTVTIPAEVTAGVSVVYSITTGGNAGEGDSEHPSGLNGPSNFSELTEQAVQEEWTQRGDLTADAMSLQDISPPHQVANLDPALGPNQVRYQATFVNEVTGEIVEVSINYDPTTGQFGMIKPASGK